MSTQTEKLQLIVGLDMSQGVRELGIYQEQLEQLRLKMAQTARDTKEYTDMQTQMRALNAQIAKTREEYGLAGMTIKELNQYARELKNQVNNIFTAGTPQWIEARKKLDEVNKAIRDNITGSKLYRQEIADAVKANGIKGLSLDQLRKYYKQLSEDIEQEADFESEINKRRIAEAKEVENLIESRKANIKGTESLLSQLKGQFPAALAGGVAGALVGIGTEAASRILDTIMQKFEEGIKFIKKRAREVSEIETTLTVDTFTASKIYGDLGKIDTQRPREELKELVLVAGDLNIAAKDVQEFVKQADKIEVAFSRDFGGVGDATTQVIKLKETFKETRDLKFDESIAKIGSTIKRLNEDGPATTKGITEFVARIGQLPDALKPAMTETAAFAAVFEEANLTAEISSGGVSNILLTASKNAEVFAKFFKMGREEFLQLLTTNPTGFLTQLAERVKGLDETKIGDLFKTLKIESQESVKVVGVLSDNLDKFRAKEAVANEAFAKGTRIDEIFKVFNNDSAAEIAKAEKKIENFTNKISGFFGTLGVSLVTSFAQLLPNVESNLENVTKKFEQQEKVVNALDSDVQKHINTIKDFNQYGHASGITQDELREAIDAVAGAIPTAISKFDEYGRALDINTAKAEQNILKQREALRQLRADAILSNEQSLESLKSQQKSIQAQLNSGVKQVLTDRRNGVVEDIKLTADEILKLQARLQQIQGTGKVDNTGKKDKGDIGAVEQQLRFLRGEPSIDDRRNERRTNNPISSSSTSQFGSTIPSDGTGEQKLDKLKEQIAKEIQIISEGVFERDLILAKEEDKRILQAERKAQRDEATAKKEIEDKTRLAVRLKQIQENLEAEVTSIRADFADKREKQVQDGILRANQLAQQQATEQLRREVELAEASSADALTIYNKKYALNEQLRKNELDNIAEKYRKEQDLLKDNAEALKISEENFQKEIAAIKAKYISLNDVLFAALLKSTKDKTSKDESARRKALVESAQLDLTDAERSGKGVFDARKALIDAQLSYELAQTDLTELEKLNIQRKYADARKEAEIARIQEVTQMATDLFGRAFSSISGLYSARLKREEQEENQRFEKVSEQLERQKDQGILTDAKYKQAKMASEKQHDKLVSENRRKQAGIDKANNIVSAIMNTAVAVTQALPNIPLAYAIGALGALEVATIAAQPLPSLKVGGDTNKIIEMFRPARVDADGGFLAINHPNEYMVSSEVRNTPFFAAVEPILESMRMGSPTPSFTPQYSGGGSSAVTAAMPQITNNITGLDRLIPVIEKLDRKLDNLRVYLGGEDFDEIRDGLSDIAEQNRESIITS
jgi:hypothetical protein